MKYYFCIFCFLVGVWRTIKLGTWLDDNVVAGHKYHEVEVEGQPDCIQILRCSRCEEQSIAWWRK